MFVCANVYVCVFVNMCNADVYAYAYVCVCVLLEELFIWQ